MSLRTHRPLRVAIATLLASAGCASPPHPDLTLEPQPIAATDFPVPLALRRGFDLPQPGRYWRVGDEVLFGLRLRRGQDVQNWLLKLRVLEPEALDDDGVPLPKVEWSLRVNGQRQVFESALARIEAQVLDGRGEPLGVSRPLVPRDFLDRGMAEVCATIESNKRRGALILTDMEGWRMDLDGVVAVRELAEATVSAMALLQVVQDDDVLAPILWQVIEKPSLWSLMRNLGARVVIQPRFYRVARTLSPVPRLYEPTWRLPMRLQVNGEPALAIDLFVADTTRPFALSGGLLGAVARHPKNPDLEFSLLLLSAKLGR